MRVADWRCATLTAALGPAYAIVSGFGMLQPSYRTDAPAPHIEPILQPLMLQPLISSAPPRSACLRNSRPERARRSGSGPSRSRARRAAPAAPIPPARPPAAPSPEPDRLSGTWARKGPRREFAARQGCSLLRRSRTPAAAAATAAAGLCRTTDGGESDRGDSKSGRGPRFVLEIRG